MLKAWASFIKPANDYIGGAGTLGHVFGGGQHMCADNGLEQVDSQELATSVENHTRQAVCFGSQTDQCPVFCLHPNRSPAEPQSGGDGPENPNRIFCMIGLIFCGSGCQISCNHARFFVSYGQVFGGYFGLRWPTLLSLHLFSTLPGGSLSAYAKCQKIWDLKMSGPLVKRLVLVVILNPVHFGNEYVHSVSTVGSCAFFDDLLFM
eukprot:EG_transcript_31087